MGASMGEGLARRASILEHRLERSADSAGAWRKADCFACKAKPPHQRSRRWESLERAMLQGFGSAGPLPKTFRAISKRAGRGGNRNIVAHVSGQAWLCSPRAARAWGERSGKIRQLYSEWRLRKRGAKLAGVMEFHVIVGATI